MVEAVSNKTLALFVHSASEYASTETVELLIVVTVASATRCRAVESISEQQRLA